MCSFFAFSLLKILSRNSLNNTWPDESITILVLLILGLVKHEYESIVGLKFCVIEDFRSSSKKSLQRKLQQSLQVIFSFVELAWARKRRMTRNEP